MNFEHAPQIGGWYRRADRPQPFQVVAVDTGARTVELEYFDGTIDEWPLTHWYGLDIEPCDPPVDARGAFDQTNPDGLSTDESLLNAEDLLNSLDTASELPETTELEVPGLEVAPRRRQKNGGKTAG